MKDNTLQSQVNNLVPHFILEQFVEGEEHGRFTLSVKVGAALGDVNWASSPPLINSEPPIPFKDLL